MAVLNRPRNRAVSSVGPAADILVCSFTTSGSTAGVTINEARGCTVARTGVGDFTITLSRVYKDVNVTFGVQASTTAQQFVVTSRNLANRTVVISQVTAASGTKVDTLAARVDVQIIARASS